MLGVEVNPRDAMTAIMDNGGHSPNSPLVFIIHILRTIITLF